MYQSVKKWFYKVSNYIADRAGHPLTFITALGLMIVWLITGPMFNYSDTWQLVVNTGTSIITFLMVFLIQNTQNVDGEAIQIKLDELIRANKDAHKVLLDLEELEEEDLNAIKKKYENLAALAREELAQGRTDTESKDV